MTTLHPALAAFGGDGEAIHTFDSGKPGPSIFIIGGTHGDEPAGIMVVARLADEFKSGALKVERGSVHLALGNPRAVAANARTAPGGTDLNRLFSTDLLEQQPTTYDLVRAQQLAHTIEASRITLDLHSTTKPSMPFVCSKADAAHERVYRWFDNHAVLEDPDLVFWGRVASMDEYADYRGRVGICVEAGHLSEVGKADTVHTSVVSVLKDQGVVAGEPEARPTEAPVYRLSVQVLYEEGFRFLDEAAVRGFMELKQGEVYAYRGTEPLRAPYDAAVIFPKAERLREVGKPVCWLAQIR